MSAFGRLAEDRPAVAGIAVMLSLALVMVFCFNTMHDARDEAASRTADAAACRSAADTIVSLRGDGHGDGRGTGAGFENESGVRRGAESTASEGTPDITRAVETARDDAALSPAAGLSINPQPPRRLGDSAYSEVSTRVGLVGVPLHQTLSFINDLCPADGGLRLNAIHLTAGARGSQDAMVAGEAAAPTGDAATGDAATPMGDTDWSADLTVSYTTAAAPTAKGDANR